MSRVTNLVLSFSLLEEEEARVGEVNTFFPHVTGFVSVDDPKLPRGWYGGSKMLETRLYVGAFNFCSWRDLLVHLKEGVHWKYPEGVQLFVQDQDDEIFSLHNLFEEEKARDAVVST